MSRFEADIVIRLSNYLMYLLAIHIITLIFKTIINSRKKVMYFKKTRNQGCTQEIFLDLKKYEISFLHLENFKFCE